jgi:hypothetical protein
LLLLEAKRFLLDIPTYGYRHLRLALIYPAVKLC